MRNQYNIELLLGNLESAKAGFEQTIKNCLKADNRDILYSCQHKLADVEKKISNTVKAKELALSARDGFISLDMKFGIDRANQFLTLLNQANRNNKKAV